MRKTVKVKIKCFFDTACGFFPGKIIYSSNIKNLVTFVYCIK